jgi:hypothetical protein
MKAYALIVYQRGKRTWSQHGGEDEARDEAKIYRDQGAEVLGIFPIEEPHDFPPLKLNGHEESNDWFGDVIVDPAYIGEHKDEPLEDFCVASIGGYECTVENLHQIKTWCEGVFEYLRKNGYEKI